MKNSAESVAPVFPPAVFLRRREGLRSVSFVVIPHLVVPGLDAWGGDDELQQKALSRHRDQEGVSPREHDPISPFLGDRLPSRVEADEHAPGEIVREDFIILFSSDRHNGSADLTEAHAMTPSGSPKKESLGDSWRATTFRHHGEG